MPTESRVIKDHLADKRFPWYVEKRGGHWYLRNGYNVLATEQFSSAAEAIDWVDENPTMAIDNAGEVFDTAGMTGRTGASTRRADTSREEQREAGRAAAAGAAQRQREAGRAAAAGAAQRLVELIKKHGGPARLRVWTKTGVGTRVYWPGNVGFLSVGYDGSVSTVLRGRRVFDEDALYPAWRQAWRFGYAAYLQEQKAGLRENPEEMEMSKGKRYYFTREHTCDVCGRSPDDPDEMICRRCKRRKRGVDEEILGYEEEEGRVNPCKKNPSIDSDEYGAAEERIAREWGLNAAERRDAVSIAKKIFRGARGKPLDGMGFARRESLARRSMTEAQSDRYRNEYGQQGYESRRVEILLAADDMALVMQRSTKPGRRRKRGNPPGDIRYGIGDFVRSYIVTALWSSTDESDESGGEPLDDNYDEADIEEATFKEIVADCEKFQRENGHLYRGRYNESDVAHDFWLTRNGHGAGFWDGDYEEPAATRLTRAAKKFGEYNLYVGDDGQIYGTSG